MATATHIRPSRLVQRLTPLPNGALGFDNMAAAEFKDGDVADALHALATDHTQLVAWTFTIDRSVYPPSFVTRKRAEIGQSTVYALARAEHRETVETRARKWAAGIDYDLRRATKISDVLRGGNDVPARGWLELDNGWFLSLDKQMWQATCRLFGVDPE